MSQSPCPPVVMRSCVLACRAPPASSGTGQARGGEHALCRGPALRGFRSTRASPLRADTASVAALAIVPVAHTVCVPERHALFGTRFAGRPADPATGFEREE